MSRISKVNGGLPALVTHVVAVGGDEGAGVLVELEVAFGSGGLGCGLRFALKVLHEAGGIRVENSLGGVFHINVFVKVNLWKEDGRGGGDAGHANRRNGGNGRGSSDATEH